MGLLPLPPMRPLSIALAALLLGGCASKRMLRLENHVLRDQNAELQLQVDALEDRAADPDKWVKAVDLDVLHRFLDRAGYVHTVVRDDSPHIRLDFGGRNKTFGINIQHFPKAGIVFLATSGFLRLEDTQNTRSAVLLMIQLATINYEMLVGKLQLNPETGEVVMSTELHVKDGLGYDTFIQALDRLTTAADEQYPDLERAASGVGL